MSDKTRKYIFYALGEILLVVIGILIALQINTWNENRKDRAFELNMLTEIRQDLQSEINDKTEVLGLFRETNHSLNELLKMRQDRTYPRDSAEVHLNNIRNAGLFFPYSDGAYEALKSGGLDKITNDELRKRLVRLYDYSFELMAIFTNELARPSMIEKFELFDQVFQPELSPGNDRIVENYDYSNFEEVILTDDFYQLLEVSHEFVPALEQRLEGLLRLMNEVQTLLDQEIEN